MRRISSQLTYGRGRPVSAQIRVSYQNITPSIQKFTSWIQSAILWTKTSRVQFQICQFVDSVYEILYEFILRSSETVQVWHVTYVRNLCMSTMSCVETATHVMHQRVQFGGAFYLVKTVQVHQDAASQPRAKIRRTGSQHAKELIGQEGLFVSGHVTYSALDGFRAACQLLVGLPHSATFTQGEHTQVILLVEPDTEGFVVVGVHPATYE